MMRDLQREQSKSRANPLRSAQGRHPLFEFFGTKKGMTGLAIYGCYLCTFVYKSTFLLRIAGVSSTFP